MSTGRRPALREVLVHIGEIFALPPAPQPWRAALQRTLPMVLSAAPAHDCSSSVPDAAQDATPETARQGPH